MNCSLLKKGIQNRNYDRVDTLSEGQNIGNDFSLRRDSLRSLCANFLVVGIASLDEDCPDRRNRVTIMVGDTDVPKESARKGEIK